MDHVLHIYNMHKRRRGNHDKIHQTAICLLIIVSTTNTVIKLFEHTHRGMFIIFKFDRKLLCTSFIKSKEPLSNCSYNPSNIFASAPLV